MLEHVNIKFVSKVFQKIFLLYLWVYFCVKVEENGVYSEVKYGSTCNSDYNSQNGQILVRIWEKLSL